MSDIDMAGDMPEEDIGDEMSDDGMAGGYNPPPELPDGVKKEVVKEGEGWKKPKAGDEVTVHYVGTLESDGSEFDSSRGRSEPFVFTLGQGSVIKGWDLGVATMKKGELAKFTLAPEYAYGEDGSPPKIPGGATLVFEVELLSWLSKDDLFQDGGAIKTMLKEGTGWRKPSKGEDVRISLRCVAKDGSVAKEHSGLDYTLGSEELGELGSVVDKALAGMKKSEEVELALSKDYALGDKTPEGATLSLTLEHMYETADISFTKDKSMMKKQIVDGETYDKPKDCAKATLRVLAATSSTGEALEGFTPQTLEFVVGNGEVCDALECAVSEMKKGEQALLSCSDAQRCVEERIGLKSVAAEKVLLTLELVEFEKAKESWNMDEDEKIEFAAGRKEVGSSLFRSGRFHLALGRYKKVLDLFSYIDDFKDEAKKTKAKELKSACNSNVAACQLKIQDFAEAKKTCDKILAEESLNVKARFRRAQAQFGLRNFLDCLADLKRIIEVDPQNREARSLLKEAQAGQREEDKKSKGLFAKMVSGLGRGPSNGKQAEKIAEKLGEKAPEKVAAEEPAGGKGEEAEAPMQVDAESKGEETA